MRRFLFFFLLCLWPGQFAFGAEQAVGLLGQENYSNEALRKLAGQVTQTGLGRDTIRALDAPSFMSVADASLSMEDSEVVFIVHYPEGRVRIYPQRILVWHEVVNDILPSSSGQSRQVPGVKESAGEAYTISYSPLSGTVVGFRSQAGNYPSSFGVTGDLLNANSVLYDRLSYSQWSQMLEISIEGPLRGKHLVPIQVVWGTWGGAKIRYHGRAEVLSRPAGSKNSYGKDPYGSYQVTGTYYDDARVLHAVSRLDSRLPPKKRILGIRQEALVGAVIVDAVAEQEVFQFVFGVIPMVALYDQELGAVRVFDRRLDGDEHNVLDIAIFEDQFVDKRTKSQWSVEGLCTYGQYRGKQLTPVYTVDAMWFTWAAFYPETQIFPRLDSTVF